MPLEVTEIIAWHCSSCGYQRGLVPSELESWRRGCAVIPDCPSCSGLSGLSGQTSWSLQEANKEYRPR